MTGRGPLPKPTALRVLNGNPGKRPFNPAEAEVPITMTLPAPEWFNERKKEIWDEVTKSLVAMKVLSSVDAKQIELYVDTLYECERLGKKIQGLSDTVMPVLGANGKPKSAKTVPYFAQLIQLKTLALRYAHHFGMTPAARARIVFLGKGGNVVNDPFDVD